MMSTAPPLCIYCREPLDSSTHEAHVVPRCLGGRLASKTMCCTDCNNALSPFEGALCDDLRTMSAVLGARNSKNQPVVTTIQVEGKTFKYANGLGQEQLPPPKYDPAMGSRTYALPGGAKEQADVIAKSLWEHGHTPEAIDAGKFRLERDTTFGVRPYPPTPAWMESELTFGTKDHLRVAAKMALELLAKRRPADSRRWGELRVARRFVRYAEGELPARVESLSRGSGLRRPRGFSALAHAIEVWTHKRNLNFRVTLFGRLRITGALSTVWEGPRLSLLHALDPARPGKHVDREAERDGPRLAVWTPELRSLAADELRTWVEVQGSRVARRAARRPWRRPPEPDLRELRPLIDAAFEALCKKRGPPKPRRTLAPVR